MKPSLKALPTSKNLENFSFEKISNDCLRLAFGEANITLHSDGRIVFGNTKSEISIQDAAITLKNANGHISLNAEGDVILDGHQVKQKSKKHIKLDAQQNIYLNSQ